MIKRFLTDIWEGAAGLLFPNLCLRCRTTIRPNAEPPLCLACFSDLSFTDYWMLPENPLTDRLAGRVPLDFAAALLHFSTGTVCQDLIHALKYHGRHELGVQLGKMLGEKLIDNPHVAGVDGLIPVPIHPKRRRQRGYNQAEHIANGISEVTGIPVFKDALIRTDFKGSQTKLTNFERMQNVQDTFAKGKGDFSGKYVLIVDDVMTTGATLDYCSQVLIDEFKDVRIGIATLATASR